MAQACLEVHDYRSAERHAVKAIDAQHSVKVRSVQKAVIRYLNSCMDFDHELEPCSENDNFSLPNSHNITFY